MVKLRFRMEDFAGADARDVPAYSIPLAAHYLHMPVATLHSWVLGRHYPTKAGRRRFMPLICLPDRKVALLSFSNLVEAHVLSSLRRYHNIRLDRIRSALRFVGKEFGTERPLLTADFETNGVTVFVRKLGQLVDASQAGQTVMRDVMSAYLKRIEREGDRACRLYPFTRTGSLDDPRSVFIDPRVSFGRPVLANCRIPTAIIAERYKAGDSIEHLAADYGCHQADIQEALRCELRLEAA